MVPLFVVAGLKKMKERPKAEKKTKWEREKRAKMSVGHSAADIFTYLVAWEDSVFFFSILLCF